MKITVHDTVNREQIKRISEDHGKPIAKWCECDDPQFAFYADDNACTCGVEKHHVHCKCGHISQVG